MTPLLAPPTTPRRVDDIGACTVLGVSSSLKPAPGRAQRSAARTLLSHGLAVLNTAYPDVSLLDLRDHPLPLFDGRGAADYESPDVEFVAGCVGRAGSLLLSVPAYWCGVSGVFKNFVDVLCGPAYDNDDAPTVFTGKHVGLLVVGADDASAAAGARHAREIMASTRARLVDEVVTAGSPRSPAFDVGEVVNRLVALGAQLAIEAGSRSARAEE